MSLPPDPFGRAALPPDHDREGRVLLLAEAFDALLAGREVPRAAAVFLGSAGLLWLSEGGDLARDYLQVAPPRGRRNTASVIWRAIRDQEAAVNNADVGPAADP